MNRMPTPSLASASIIRLDGSGSTDPDGDALRYRWSFTTRPADSALTDADSVMGTSTRFDVGTEFAVSVTAAPEPVTVPQVDRGPIELNQYDTLLLLFSPSREVAHEPT